MILGTLFRSIILLDHKDVLDWAPLEHHVYMLFCPATRYSLHRALFNVPARLFAYSTVIERLKNPTRGGQNLSERFKRLEKSLRGKTALSQELESSHTHPGEITVGSPPKNVETFRGFVIPSEPRPPSDEECCMSGCAVCVYDLYEESLEAYKEKINALRASLSALRVPESEWPKQLQSVAASGGVKRQDVILDAFEEMERALKEK